MLSWYVNVFNEQIHLLIISTQRRSLSGKSLLINNLMSKNNLCAVSQTQALVLLCFSADIQTEVAVGL